MKKLFIFTFTFFQILTPCHSWGDNSGPVNGRVQRIIDGDTLVLSGGARVRLLGLDTPETGEPFFIQARKRLRELTGVGNVTLKICEEMDPYGRYLATVRTGGININRILLEEGLAFPMLIPPCGRIVAEYVLDAAAQGIRSRMGIYSLDRYRIISHVEAAKHIGEDAVVMGKALILHKGKRAWHLNFGKDWKTDFTAVFFKDGQNRFRELDIDPGKYVGTSVLVLGRIKRYNGPEIIVRGPEQILRVEEKTIQDSRFNTQYLSVE